MLEKAELVSRTAFFKHIRFSQPLTILMDGKQKTSAILIE
jgi:hypothetical protein